MEIGERLGAYEVLAKLGEGGMGEVYRARDTRLHRDVAVKVIAAGGAADAARLARFEQEARATAALNHTNIVAVFDIGQGPRGPFIVSELLEGESLRHRLTRGRVPIRTALEIGAQLARGLAAAHDKGIVHRDLKPENIFLATDGTAKILDFGLAKLRDEPMMGGAAGSPTVTLAPARTEAGMVLGTVGYMAPEQVRGEPVDHRADLFALGCVLYEMLTGQRAFSGSSSIEVLHAILTGDPGDDVTSVTSAMPTAVRRIVLRCLEKAPAQRFQSARDLSFALEVTGGAPGASETPDAAGRHDLPSATAGPRWAWSVAAAGLFAGLAFASAAAWLLGSPTTAPALVRFTITPPAGQGFYANHSDRNLAISPDGRYIAYIAAPSGQLMLRALDQLEAVPVRGVTGANAPFFSPDGRWIAFFTGLSGELRKVPVSGGAITSIIPYEGRARGAAWVANDTIVFATSATAALTAVSADGRDARRLTTVDEAGGERQHMFPSPLPGGRALLFTVAPADATVPPTLAVADLTTGEHRVLLQGGSQGVYSEGVVVFAAANGLRAVRFDPARLDTVGTPVPVVEDVGPYDTGAAEFDISSDGTLVYVAGRIPGAQQRRLVWATRDGRYEPLPAPPRPYGTARVSPDGTRIVTEIRDQQHDVWVLDIARETLTRLTFDPSVESSPVWSRDGRHVAFGAGGHVYVHAADGTGTPRRLTEPPDHQVPLAAGADRQTWIVGVDDPETQTDLFVLRVEGSPRIAPLVRSPRIDTHAALSPNGRWLAYASRESGEFEVYVRPFPVTDAGRWQISTSGGARPVWSPDGRELFYGTSDAVMRVAVDDAGGFRAGAPVKLFEVPPSFGITGRGFDIASDGTRFLLIETIGEGQAPAISVAMNWRREVDARVEAAGAAR